MLSGPKTILSIEQFAARLAPVLGSDQALLTVRAGLRAIAHEGEGVTPDDQRSVLAWLGAQTGVVAAAARHLLRKFDGAGDARSISAPAQRSSVSHVALVGVASDAIGEPAPSAPIDTGLRRALCAAAAPVLEDAARSDGVARSELVEMFAGAMGHERAQQLVDARCEAHGASGPWLARHVAVTVLEELAGEPGVVGVVARFAKARVALKPR